MLKTLLEGFLFWNDIQLRNGALYILSLLSKRSTMNSAFNFGTNRSRKEPCLESNQVGERLKFHVSARRSECGVMKKLQHLMNLTPDKSYETFRLRITKLWQFHATRSVILRVIKIPRTRTTALYLAANWQWLVHWNALGKIQAWALSCLFPMCTVANFQNHCCERKKSRFYSYQINLLYLSLFTKHLRRNRTKDVVRFE